MRNVTKFWVNFSFPRSHAQFLYAARKNLLNFYILCATKPTEFHIYPFQTISQFSINSIYRYIPHIYTCTYIFRNIPTHTVTQSHRCSLYNTTRTSNRTRAVSRRKIRKTNYPALRREKTGREKRRAAATHTRVMDDGLRFRISLSLSLSLLRGVYNYYVRVRVRGVAGSTAYRLPCACVVCVG